MMRHAWATQENSRNARNQPSINIKHRKSKAETLRFARSPTDPVHKKNHTGTPSQADDPLDVVHGKT